MFETFQMLMVLRLQDLVRINLKIKFFGKEIAIKKIMLNNVDSESPLNKLKIKINQEIKILIGYNFIHQRDLIVNN